MVSKVDLVAAIFWFSGLIVLIAEYFISLQIKEMALSYFRQIKTMNFAFLFDYEFEKSKQEGNSIVLKTENKKLIIVYDCYKIAPGHWLEEVYLCVTPEFGRIDNKFRFLFWTLKLRKALKQYELRKKTLTRRW